MNSVLLLVNLERILVSLEQILVSLELILVIHRNEHAFFSLSFTMHLEFNEEFVVLTCQLPDTFIN
ncbi:hypothetical protein P4576_05495 [Peribacillus frigoritolerans]|uniref:hypothetical protein n=1 Tax=Peribacillus frigoritolerans TaxID=450367 RepID=UPI002E1F929C|nr:hypothetical protein [Peribacillus frigoritolerans]